MTASITDVPESGSKAVSLSLKLPSLKSQPADHLAGGLQQLYQQGEFTDVALVCGDCTMYAHRIVLAAGSEVFKHGLESGETVVGADGARRIQVRLADVSEADAVKFMLDYMYESDACGQCDYNPKTQEINKDVLSLAHNFHLVGLKERAANWLAKSLNTSNVVERLTLCETFGLHSLGEKILEQIMSNKQALAEVAKNPEIMMQPRIMQALLRQASTVKEDPVKEDPVPQAGPKKKARKGSA